MSAGRPTPTVARPPVRPGARDDVRRRIRGPSPGLAGDSPPAIGCTGSRGYAPAQQLAPPSERPEPAALTGRDAFTRAVEVLARRTGPRTTTARHVVPSVIPVWRGVSHSKPTQCQGTHRVNCRSVAEPLSDAPTRVAMSTSTGATAVFRRGPAPAGQHESMNVCSWT